jgi:hypothetical protein
VQYRLTDPVPPSHSDVWRLWPVATFQGPVKPEVA